MPAYVLGFVFLSILDFPGPVQTALRGVFGEGAWFPDVRSLGGDASDNFVAVAGAPGSSQEVALATIDGATPTIECVHIGGIPGFTSTAPTGTLVIQETGAVEYSRGVATELAEEAREALESLELESGPAETLAEFPSYMIERQR
jgi:hypothetical protein